MSATLAGARAELAILEQAKSDHRHHCPVCARARVTCPDRAGLEDQAAALRATIAGWHDPGPDQLTLL